MHPIAMGQGRDVACVLAASIAFATSCQRTASELRIESTARAPQPAPTSEPETSRAKQDNLHLLISDEDCKRPPAETITRDDARSDLAIVEEVLRTGYAGYRVLAAEGHDWERSFESARMALPRLGTSLEVEVFRKFLLDAFGFTRDGHLAFWTVQADGSWNWASAGIHTNAYTTQLTFEEKAGKLFLDGAELIDCDRDLATVFHPSWNDGKPSTLLIRLSERPPAAFSCRTRSSAGETTQSVELRPVRVPAPRRDEEQPNFSESTKEMPVLRIASFGSSKDEQMAAFVQAGERLRDSPVIVADLRGNPGGSDNYVRDFFLNLTAGTLRYNVIEALESATTLQGTVNWATCTIASDDLDASGRETFEQMRRDSLDHLEDPSGSKASWSVRTPQWEGEAPKPYAGNLIALVDRTCASACESFIMFARQLPGTLVVGENTAGVGVFAETRLYRLPRSGIWMQAGRKWFHNPDPAKIAREGYGHQPDLWLDAEDPLAATIDIARCMKTKRCADKLWTHVSAVQPALPRRVESHVRP